MGIPDFFNRLRTASKTVPSALIGVGVDRRLGSVLRRVQGHLRGLDWCLVHRVLWLHGLHRTTRISRWGELRLHHAGVLCRDPALWGQLVRATVRAIHDRSQCGLLRLLRITWRCLHRATILVTGLLLVGIGVLDHNQTPFVYIGYMCNSTQIKHPPSVRLSNVGVQEGGNFSLSRSLNRPSQCRRPFRRLHRKQHRHFPR